MAKRELITKEDALMALTGCFELGVTLNKYSASCQKHIEAIKPITEQEIVRPYLTKLRADIVASIEDIKGKYDDTLSEHDRPLCKCARNEVRLEIIEWIDKLLTELGG